MKHQAINLVKFKALARTLKQPMCHVVGYLETLWIFCQIQARDGDLTKFSAVEIAGWIEYPGDEVEFVDALIRCKWLDRTEDGRLLIHDWDENKPNWLKGVNARASKNEPPGNRPGKEPGHQPSSAPGLEPSSEPAPQPPNVTQRNPTQPNQSLSSSGDDASETIDAEPVGVPAVTPDDVMDAWNASKATHKVRRRTKGRRSRLRIRLRDPTWPWAEAIAKLPIPNTERFTWQPDIDWLVANDENASKLADGRYDKACAGASAGVTYDPDTSFGDGF